VAGLATAIVTARGRCTWRSGAVLLSLYAALGAVSAAA
jgi:hypothetical protein